MLRGRQLLLTPFFCLSLSQPVADVLVRGNFLPGSIVEVRSYEEEDYDRAVRYRRGVAIALLAAAGIALFAVRKSTTRR